MCHEERIAVKMRLRIGLVGKIYLVAEDLNFQLYRKNITVTGNFVDRGWK